MAITDRDNGFNKGSVTVDQKTYTLTMDRGRSFQLDREDEDETGVANLAGQVLSEFVRTKVAPEVDAYVLSKLATTAVTNAHTVTDSNPATKIYSLFMKALNGRGQPPDTTRISCALSIPRCGDI